jgi:hypothetical protein
MLVLSEMRPTRLQVRACGVASISQRSQVCGAGAVGNCLGHMHEHPYS